MSPWLDDPEHWRNRAEEALAVASQMKNEIAISHMKTVANTYILLAKMAEQLRRDRSAPRLQQPEMTLRQLTIRRRV